MNKLENLCIWKVMSNNKKSTTFQDVKIGNGLYNCYYCTGKPGSCPNYKSRYKLLEKYSKR